MYNFIKTKLHQSSKRRSVYELIFGKKTSERSKNEEINGKGAKN